jgi:hypothetical protein
MTHEMRFGSGTQPAQLLRFSSKTWTHNDTRNLVSTSWRIRTDTPSELVTLLKNSFVRFCSLFTTVVKASRSGLTNLSVQTLKAHSLEAYLFTAKTPTL